MLEWNPPLTGRTLGISYEIKKQMERAHVLHVLLSALKQGKVHLLLYVLVNKQQSLRMNKMQLQRSMVLIDIKWLWEIGLIECWQANFHGNKKHNTVHREISIIDIPESLCNVKLIQIFTLLCVQETVLNNVSGCTWWLISITNAVRFRLSIEIHL